MNPDGVEPYELNRPRVVWDLLKKHFREEYFLEPIEEDFGITPGSDKMLRDMIQKQIVEFQKQMNAERTRL